tara:strand:+ start:561 stop:851 length:291 start_codon:yes stop_codon:yes gene_type:complete
MNKLETKEDGLYIGDKKVIKGWESFSGWYWFATEKDGTQDSLMADGTVAYEDIIWFGYVQGIHDEWGYFAESDFKSMPNKIWEIKEIDLPHAGRRD